MIITISILIGFFLGWSLAIIMQGGTQKDKLSESYRKGFNAGREYEYEIGRWERE